MYGRASHRGEFIHRGARVTPTSSHVPRKVTYTGFRQHGRRSQGRCEKPFTEGFKSRNLEGHQTRERNKSEEESLYYTQKYNKMEEISAKAA
jgi:hypothetical protein